MKRSTLTRALLGVVAAAAAVVALTPDTAQAGGYRSRGAYSRGYTRRGTLTLTRVLITPARRRIMRRGTISSRLTTATRRIIRCGPTTMTMAATGPEASASASATDLIASRGAGHHRDDARRR